MTEELPPPMFKSIRAQEDQNPTTPSTSDDGAHLDNIRMPEIEDDKDDLDAPILLDDDGNEIAAIVEPEQVTRDAFFVLFKTAFSTPQMFARDFAPLAIQDEEEGAARGASDALYALLEIYYPSALMPQSETFAHLLTLGVFLTGKVMLVRSILAARAAPPEVEQVNKEGETSPPRDDPKPQSGSNFAPDWGYQS